MNMPVQAVVLVALVLTTATPRVSGSIIIDDFKVGSISLEKTEPTVPIEFTQSGLNTANVAGGARNLLFGQSGGIAQTLTIEADPGRMIYETVEVGGDFGIIYGSDDSPLNLDLSHDGTNAFVIDVDPDEILSNLNLGVSLISNGFSLAAHGLGSEGVTPQPLPNGQARVTIPFRLYNTQGRLRDVDQIIIGAARFGPNNRLVIHRFATIPEPSSALQVLMSVVTIGLVRR